jgi:serine/threonine protein kinase
LSDFDILGRAGDGSFSTVILVQHKGTGIEYAIKIINKHVIMRNKIVDYIKNERNILDKLNYEGVVQLKFTFQDEDSLCKPLWPANLLQQYHARFSTLA